MTRRILLSLFIAAPWVISGCGEAQLGGPCCPIGVLLCAVVIMIAGAVPSAGALGFRVGAASTKTQKRAGCIAALAPLIIAGIVALALVGAFCAAHVTSLKHSEVVQWTVEVANNDQKVTGRIGTPVAVGATPYGTVMPHPIVQRGSHHTKIRANLYVPLNGPKGTMWAYVECRGTNPSNRAVGWDEDTLEVTYLP